jgi:hypothetical protein
MTRLSRLRPVAFLSTCRDTAMPSRGAPRPFGRAKTLKQRSAETTGFEKTLLNSIGFLRRAEPGKAARASVAGWSRPAVDSVTVQGLAAPGAAACQQACAGARNSEHQAERRLRPLARRALMTACPARVAIRARKPCLRARFRQLGWNVRFIALSLRRFVLRPGRAPRVSATSEIPDKRA